MKVIKNIKLKCLNEDNFEEYPVWAWDDENERLCPVELDGTTLPEDLGDLFIKSKIIISNGREFNGYVGGLVSFHCFGVFIEHEEFLFNINLGDFFDDEIAKIRNVLKTEQLDFFPVRYKTQFHFPGKNILAGEFVR